MQNDFEAPASAISREIAVGGKKATYLFREPSASALERLFDVADREGKVDPEKSRGLRFRVIAAVVARADGTPITVEEAEGMRLAVVNALYRAANEVIGNDTEASAAGKD